jgi:hypothetical protein
MKTLKRMFKKDENEKVQLFIEKVKKNEKAKATAYSKRTTYINPCGLRLGSGVRKEGMFYFLQPKDYCPV